MTPVKVATDDDSLKNLNPTAVCSLQPPRPHLITDDGVSKRGNINTAALVTMAQCNTLVARCSRQLIGPADWVFVTMGPLRCD